MELDIAVFCAIKGMVPLIITRKQPNGNNNFPCSDLPLLEIYFQIRGRRNAYLGVNVSECVWGWVGVHVHTYLRVCLCISVFCEGWVASLFNGSHNAMEVLVKFLALGHSRVGLPDCHPSVERPG